MRLVAVVLAGLSMLLLLPPPRRRPDTRLPRLSARLAQPGPALAGTVPVVLATLLVLVDGTRLAAGPGPPGLCAGGRRAGPAGS